MEIPQLRAELFRQINPMLDSDEMLRKMIAYVKSLLAAQPSEQEAAQEKGYDEEPLKPYTIEELHARIAQSERDIAEGRVQDFDDFMRELEEEFAEEDRKELSMLGAV